VCASELAALAPLPALIAKTDPGEVELHSDAARSERITAGARRELDAIRRRVRRWKRVAAGLAAAVVVLFALVVVDPGGDSDGPPTLAATVTDSSAATADVVVGCRAWGIEIALDITGLPTRDGYQLWTIDTNGAWISAATWSLSPTGVVRLTGASRTPADAIDRIVVTSDQRDDPLVTATL
jgi:anti-sigma-K factor RskA